MTRQKKETLKRLSFINIDSKLLSVVTNADNRSKNERTDKNKPNCIVYPNLRMSGATNYYLYKI